MRKQQITANKRERFICLFDTDSILNAVSMA